MSLHSFGRTRRDDRRRRLLAEEYTADGSQPTVAASAWTPRIGEPPVHKSENYGDAEFMDQQRRLIDLIPQRRLTIALAYAVGLVAIAGLEALYSWIPDLLPQTAGIQVATFNLNASGSLASWLSSLLLLAAGLVAVEVYSIRRHKVDDYHGHYRVWLWAASCWFLMATDASATLHEGFKDILVAATGTRVIGDGSIWWIAPSVFLLGAVGSRLLVDMWSNRPSSVALIVALACYITAYVVSFGGMPPDWAIDRVLLGQGAKLGGHLTLLLAMVLHLHYVILDTQGLVPRRVAKADKNDKDQESKPKLAVTDSNDANQADSASETADDDAESADKWVAVDSSHGKTQPVLKRVTPPSPAAAASTTSASASPVASKPAAAVAPAPAPAPAVAPTLSMGSSDDRQLSKAERKALKKRMMDERIKQDQKKASGWGR
jgi:hypothetical protein